MATTCNTPTTCSGGSTPTTCSGGSTPATCSGGSTPTTCTHTHSYSTIIGTVAPTCSKAGYNTLKCSCGDTKQQTINATGIHTYSTAYSLIKAPTCGTTGTEAKMCIYNCGAFTGSRTVPATGNHIYGSSWTNCSETQHMQVCLTCGLAPRYEAHATSGTCKCGKVISAPTTTYIVSYNANNGSGAPASQTKTNNVTLTLSCVKPTRSGYDFQGWATGSTSTSVSYQPASPYTNNASITLYAVWKATTTVPTTVTQIDPKSGKTRGDYNLRSSPNTTITTNIISMIKKDTPMTIKGFCKDNTGQEWYWLGGSEYMIKEGIMVDPSSSGSSGKTNPHAVSLPLSGYPNNASFPSSIQIDAAWQCDAFARLVFNAVYGYYPTRLSEVSADSKTKKSLNQSNLYGYLTTMGKYSYFRGWTQPSTNYPVGVEHSVFIVSFTNTTVTYYDANSTADTVKYKENVSYTDFLSLFQYYIWHYSN